MIVMFPSNWSKLKSEEWLIDHEFVKNLSLFRSHNGVQFWFHLCAHITL